LAFTGSALPKLSTLPLMNDNSMNPFDLARTIDHTILKPDAPSAAIDILCAEALQMHFASVCVLPWFVERCAETLAGSDVAVCTVVGFPLGGTTTTAKVAETTDVIKRGATEVDMVINLAALKSEQYGTVLDDIRAVTDVAHAHSALVKVIIETCLLTDDEKRRCASMVTQAGADFIKTSTGFSTGGATIADVELLRHHVGPHVRVKASGGVRDRQTALNMIQAGAQRIGTSSGVVIVSK
jgi:deoxyribose-phosphate aldolase